MKRLKQSLRRRHYGRAIAFFLIYGMFLNISLPVAMAGPEGAQVINGNVSIQQSAYNTTITASDKAIINYSSFDIARPETVQFIQPSSSASVLNRILSARPTNINGTLLANGRVFFVNPAGIYIGAGARINVNQLVASGLNISNSDFINGRYDFAGGNGSVINSGEISAEQVYLIGKQVTNSGNINCPAGYVVMAAGDRVFLGEPGSEIILEMDAPSLSESADAGGSGAGVLNEGTIDAAGGIIALAAAGDIYSQAISNVGTISASVETGNAGNVKLAAAEGTVINNGTIEASGGQGGHVAMEGARVGQFGTIHADGISGDGGNVDLWASEVVALSSDSLTTVNAAGNGNGGEVIVCSPDTALFWANAQIEAKGGSESGDGGFVEVSGKEHVEIYGMVDTRAMSGENGTFLIDPTNVTITGADTSGSWSSGTTGTWTPSASGSVANVDTALQTGNVIVTTNFSLAPAPEEEGDIIVASAVTASAQPYSLTLQAANDIKLNANIDMSTGTGNLTLTADSDGSGAGDVEINAAISLTTGNLTSSGVNFASSGTITTTGGEVDLTGHTGTVDIDAAIIAGGPVGIDGSSIEVATDITGVGITFGNAVTANGIGPQVFNATTDTLLAGSTMTKTGGNLTLSGNLIDLGDAVHVQAGNLIVTDSVDAGGLLQASGAVHLQGTANELAGDIVGAGITFDNAVTADGGSPQVFNAGTGTLTASDTITKTGAGGLTLGGATGIDLNGSVDVQGGSLTLVDNTSVADGETLQASGNVILATGKTLTGEGALTLEATGGGITAGVINMSADDQSLRLTQNDTIDMADFSVTNDEDTNLVANSTGGSVTSTTADDWQSIAATAENNIELSSIGDIRIASAGLSSTSGGVKVISTGGAISTPGAGGPLAPALDAPITGSSNQAGDIGVGLPFDDTQKAAIVISSKDNLTLDTNARLTANGSYNPAANDDRESVDFDTSPTGGGDPLDVAIYLRSSRLDPSQIGTVTVNSTVQIANDGSMVVDAGERVAFGDEFGKSVFNQTQRLEVVSRISTFLDEVIRYDRLPFADNPDAIRSWFLPPGSFSGAYVLRGKELFAEILAFARPVPLVPPKPLEPEVGSEVEGPDTEALEELLNELGIGVQPYVTEAYAASLSTDLRLYSAAEKLQQLIPILEDADGTGTAALRATVAQVFPSLDALSEEQVSSFAQELVRHKGDGTDYDVAGQCIFALTEYVTILGNDVGWPVEKSVGFVMGRYVPRLTEGDEIRIAVIQMQLQKALGV